MRLWLLRPKFDLPRDDNPWYPPEGKALGFVVRATTENRARHLAHHHAGDENNGRAPALNRPAPKTTVPWLDANYTTCVPLEDDGDEDVVIRDFGYE